MSTPPKRKHGHERDATQLASSGSIPTKVAPKPHATAPVWCVRRYATMSRTDLLSNTAFWKLCEFYSVLRVRQTFFRVEDTLISIADVSRAHFYADAVRDVNIRLSNEDPKAKEPGV